MAEQETQGIPGFASEFYMNDTRISEVVSVTMPQVEVDVLDFSNMDSPNNYREFRGGFADPGSCDLELIYRPDTCNVLYGQVREDNSFSLILQDGSQWSADGYIKSLSVDAPAEDKVTMSVTIKLTSVPVFTSAHS